LGLRLVSRVMALVAIVVAAATLVVSFGSFTNRWRLVTILSGSMEPEIHAGDIVIATPETLEQVQAGQVIVYKAPIGDRRPVAHRIVRVISPGAHPVVITKGDANEARDPWRARLDGPFVWRARVSIPAMGRLLLFLGRGWVRTMALMLTVFITVWVGLRWIWTAPSPPEPARLP
jgi:signal peptidase I